ncbi:MAG: hypothetical protein J5483_01255 [Lachnospiraceae bacterium]|nr:hypothetical protein [Lachnospiraceae bacterium]
MKKAVVLFVCLIGSIAILAGCRKGPAKDAVLDDAIFGTWNQITEDGSASLEDLGIPSGYTFNEDGTGTDLFWDLSFKYQTDQGILYLDYDDVSCDDSDYTYVIDGDVITMTRNAKDAITMLYRKEVPEQETEQETETEQP